MNKLALGLVIACTPALAFAGKTYNDGSGGTWDCSKDPAITINIDKGTFTFTGTCGTISVNGNGNTITVAGTKMIVLNGNSNTATLAAVQTIQANGNSNTVTYAKDAKPKVQALGSSNKIGPGDAGAGAKAPAGGGGGGGGDADSGVIDCAKHPTYGVDSNGGLSLKFVGKCDKIEVSTGDNNVQIESVKTLELNGGGNKVSVGAVDAVITNGAKNNVTYKKGVSGAKPKVSGAGADNTVVQAK